MGTVQAKAGAKIWPAFLNYTFKSNCMERNFTAIIKRVLPMLVLLMMQASAHAVETTAATHDSTNFLSQPWIWIAVIVVSIIILAGPFDYKKDYSVIMKKKNTTNKRTVRTEQ